MNHRTDALQLAPTAAGARPCVAMRHVGHGIESSAAATATATWSFATKRGNGYGLKRPARHLGTPPT